MAITKGKALVAHVVGSGASAIILELPDNYSGVASLVGVQKLTGDPPDGATGTDIADALHNGLIAKIRISYLENGKRKTGNLICSIDKLKSAIKALRGKTFGGHTIKSAYFPSRRRFS